MWWYQLGFLLLVIVIKTRDAHFLQPPLNNFVNQTIVPDKAPFVLGLMVALRTLVSGIRRSGGGWRKALAQPFPEVTIAQMTQKHVPPVESAFAQRAVLPVRLLGLVPLEDAVVVAVHDAHALVQVLQNHFVRHSVMPGQKLEIFAHE